MVVAVVIVAAVVVVALVVVKAVVVVLRLWLLLLLLRPWACGLIISFNFFSSGDGRSSRDEARLPRKTAAHNPVEKVERK